MVHKAEILWYSVDECLPEIPKNKYGIRVLAAQFDPVYAEVSPGNGGSVSEILYAPTTDREGNKLRWFKGIDREFDFMELYTSGANHQEWGPTGDAVTHWAYVPEFPTCGIKVYLDNENIAPRGWVRTTTSFDTIELLKTQKVATLSLTYYLGDTQKFACGTGYDVLLFIAQQVAYADMTPPKIIIHATDQHARVRMENSVSQINKVYYAILSSGQFGGLSRDLLNSI